MLTGKERPKVKETFFDVVCISIYIICIALSKFPVASIASVFVFIGYCLYIVEHKGYFFIKYLYIVFIAFAAITSCVVIEFGSLYVSELRTEATYYGSLPLFVLSFHILFRVILLFESGAKSNLQLAKIELNDRKDVKIIKYISIVVFIIVLVCFIKVLPHPAFINSLERADYARLYGLTGFLGRLSANIPRLIIFPYILLMTKNRINKLLATCCVILTVLYYFWTGNKFGVFFQLLYIFLIVFSENIISKVGKRKLKRIIVRIGIAFLCLIIATLVIQSFTYNGKIWLYFQQRIASQGQLWWRIYGLFNGTSHVGEFSNEIRAAFTAKSDVLDNVGANYGIYKMMYLCLPANVVDNYLKAGYRYTEAGFATMIYYFGMIGPIIYAIVMGVSFGWLVNKLCKAISNRDFIRIYIYIRFILLATTSFSMFIFKPFFTVAQFILYLYLICTHNRKLKIGALSLGGIRHTRVQFDVEDMSE